MRAVLDASVALGAVLVDEDPATGPYALGVLRAILNGDLEPVVPAVWHAEVAGVLLRRLRAGRLAKAAFEDAIALFRSMRLETHHQAHTVEGLIERAQRYGLQAIDALYVNLAVSLQLPLATLDGGLRTAAKAQRVPIFAPP